MCGESLAHRSSSPAELEDAYLATRAVAAGPPEVEPEAWPDYSAAHAHIVDYAAWIGPLLVEVGLVDASSDPRVVELADLVTAALSMRPGRASPAAPEPELRTERMDLHDELDRRFPTIEGFRAFVQQRHTDHRKPCPLCGMFQAAESEVGGSSASTAERPE
jgi:hypothetical protein